MYDKIEKYISSMIPASISDKQWSLIHDELACHIYDRIDFFIEIGYDEEASIDKAIEEFGASEEITQQIASQFEELYRERTWVAVLAGVGTLVMNLLAAFSGSYLISIDYNFPDGYKEGIFGFIFVLLMLMTTAITYKKGYSKTPGFVGAANILIGLSMYWCMYPQTTVYYFYNNLLYLIDRYTPMILVDSTNYYDTADIAFLGGIVFAWAIGTINIILAYRISKKGLPKNRSYRGIILFAVMFIIAAAGSLQIQNLSEDYFYSYHSLFWLYEEGAHNIENDIIDSFDDKTDFDKAEKDLISKGYMNIKNYEAGLSKNEAKRFKYNLQSINFFFGDDYEVYFKPIENFDPDFYYNGKGYIMDDIDENPTTSKPKERAKAFIYLRKGDDGKVKSKGIGCACDITNSVDCYTAYATDYDVHKCLIDFQSLRLGETKEEILKRVGTPEGDVYSKFITYTDDGIDEQYRIYFRNDAQINIAAYDYYVQINFENGKLADGSMSYSVYDEEKEADVVRNIKIAE